jgi:2'-5' RNA ligase
LSSSGLVLLVPELGPLINDLRDRHDPAARQGMPPHVTVLYPFMAPVKLGPTRRRRLAEVIRAFPPMELSFSRIGRFPEVLWVAPEPAEPVATMVRAIAAAFPDYPPYGGQFDTIIPHVTVAHGEGFDLAALEPRLRARFARPVACRVEAVSLFTTVRRKWREIDRFRLA